MTTIKANASKMFEHIEPWDVSNSVANLGPRAGELTWGNALKIAEAGGWLESDLDEACGGMRDWARSTGAWDKAEIEDMTDSVVLALFVQNIASELRELGVDETDLQTIAALPRNDDCSSIGWYFPEGSDVKVEYYTGC